MGSLHVVRVFAGRYPAAIRITGTRRGCRARRTQLWLLGALSAIALLFGVRPEDPLTITLAAALCLAIALVGCLRPALRAARVDPLSALRVE